MPLQLNTLFVPQHIFDLAGLFLRWVANSNALKDCSPKNRFHYLITTDIHFTYLFLITYVTPGGSVLMSRPRAVARAKACPISELTPKS